MATTEERLATSDAMLTEMQARLTAIRAWLIALTGVSAAQWMALVAMALALARR
jgi:hypothetical protein